MRTYIWLVIIILSIFYYNNYGYTNYLEYNGKQYELIPKNIFMFNKELYLRSDNMSVNIVNPNITVVIIFKKNNYKCLGLIGQRQINVYNYDVKTQFINFHKNSTCFPNGGLEPEYLIVLPKNKKINSYWASMRYEPYNDTNMVYNFFSNYKEQY